MVVAEAMVRCSTQQSRTAKQSLFSKHRPVVLQPNQDKVKNTDYQSLTE